LPSGGLTIGNPIVFPSESFTNPIDQSPTFNLATAINLAPAINFAPAINLASAVDFTRAIEQ
jgi:hypothetical protein